MSEKQEKILRIGKIVNRITLLIGALTIVLPLVFWKWIPKEIPAHYDSGGTVDRMGDKGELILLFFVIAFVMGVMSVALYLVKTNATSKYAKEEDSQSTTTIYPMLLIMNLAVILMFSYIMFCSVTMRSLGGWFLPVSLTGTFAPVVYYLIKEFKFRQKNKPELADYKYCEKTEAGECYRTKIDWWLGILLLGAVLGTVWGFIGVSMEKGKFDWIMFLSAAACAVIVAPLFFVKYILYSEYILVSCGIYGKERIPYKSIVNIKGTHNPLASAALSLDRLQIDYMINGRHDTVLISPVRKKEFIAKVQERRVYGEVK